MARTYAQVSVRGRYLFRKRGSKKTVNFVEDVMSKEKYLSIFFKVKWRLLCLLSLKYFSQHAGSARLSYVNLVIVCQLAFTIPTSYTIFRFRFNRKHMLEEKVQQGYRESNHLSRTRSKRKIVNTAFRKMYV